MRNIYLLKDLAAISGNSIHTIKYYLKLGLFKEFGRSQTTRFRYFNDDALDALKTIRSRRRSRVSLKDIKRELSDELLQNSRS